MSDQKVLSYGCVAIWNLLNFYLIYFINEISLEKKE